MENDDLIVLALKIEFQEAQEMCAELRIKPNVVRDGSWWIEPWTYGKKIEASLYGSMKDNECDYDHILIDDPILHEIYLVLYDNTIFLVTKLFSDYIGSKSYSNYASF